MRSPNPFIPVQKMQGIQTDVIGYKERIGSARIRNKASVSLHTAMENDLQHIQICSIPSRALGNRNPEAMIINVLAEIEPRDYLAAAIS